MDNVKIASFIAAKRKEKNMTQQQLADKLHVTHKAVSKWETAKGMPDISIIPCLCEALDISPARFFAGEDTDNTPTPLSDSLIVSVAHRYQTAGKKQMLCFTVFVVCMIFLIVSSFFGDGAAKIITEISAYIVSAISVYKLASISTADIKQLQKFAAMCLVLMVAVSISLGINYFTAKNTGNIVVTTHMAYLIFGDYSYTLHKFLMGFKNSAARATLVAGQNLYLLSARLKYR